MTYWTGGIAVTVLVLTVLLWGAELLRSAIPWVSRLGVPGSIVAGLLGLVAGPQALGWVPLDGATLEFIVYHGLAVVFIAVGLQAPPPGGGGRGAASIAFGVSSMITLQATLGLTLILVLGWAVGPLHPGLGLMLPMGFEQGPGQALAFGGAWESQTEGPLRDGTQIGLIVAALGFAWSVGVGVPLVLWGRMRGLVSPHRMEEAAALRGESAGRLLLPAGALDLLTRQVVAIGVCYLLTYGVVVGVASAVPGVAQEVYGLHFIVGGAVAMAARWALAKTTQVTPLDDALLGRIAGLAVDGLTCGALAGLQIAVFRSHWLPLVVVTTAGGVVTLCWCLWFSRRAFPDEPFEHCVVWFGMSTGTLPMGLALLRMIDPDLRSPASANAVLGSAGAAVGAAPMLLFFVPAAAKAWPGDYPTTGWMFVGAMAAYLVVVLALWRWLGPLGGGRASRLVGDDQVSDVTGEGRGVAPQA